MVLTDHIRPYWFGNYEASIEVSTMIWYYSNNLTKRNQWVAESANNKPDTEIKCHSVSKELFFYNFLQFLFEYELW